MVQSVEHKVAFEDLKTHFVPLSIHRGEDIEASPLLDLEVIKIVSDCNEEYVSFILGMFGTPFLN